MRNEIINVEGMSCEHCVKAITGALTQVGVAEVQVNLNEKTVSVQFDEEIVTLETIKNAIEDQGYDIV